MNTINPSSLNSKGKIKRISGEEAIKLSNRSKSVKKDGLESLVKRIEILENIVSRLEKSIQEKTQEGIFETKKPSNINFDEMVNQKAKETNKKDKLAFLTCLVDENIKIRNGD